MYYLGFSCITFIELLYVDLIIVQTRMMLLVRAGAAALCYVLVVSTLHGPMFVLCIVTLYIVIIHCKDDVLTVIHGG
jgi:hypothetical protein